ncbi:class I SAM-dependent methyltransferase [Candidatus Woesearchaeota archaeon]|nr:class I SAM-dependent methyltransferase [Candidatus Woesearchaeota archaeon]
MSDKEMKDYVNELIKRYGYYDPIEDRMEALRSGKIKNAKLLDIGSGKGYLAILATKEFNCNVTSIDKSKEKIKLAKENAGKEGVMDKIEFKLCDAAKLPFKANSFDVAFSFGALHHIKNKHMEVIKEMFRVSTDKVIVTELNNTGIRAFDGYVHPEENHRAMAIDLKELENRLQQYSRVKRFDRKMMSTFVCRKNNGGN